MTLGVTLLKQVFEAFIIKSARKETLVRLYLDAGIGAKKAYEKCSDDVKIQMVDITTSDDTHIKNHLSVRTTTRVLDELVWINELGLLSEVYKVLRGTADKGFKYCKPKTQEKILELGLYK